MRNIEIRIDNVLEGIDQPYVVGGFVLLYGLCGWLGVLIAQQIH